MPTPRSIRAACAPDARHALNAGVGDRSMLRRIGPAALWTGALLLPVRVALMASEGAPELLLGLERSGIALLALALLMLVGWLLSRRPAHLAVLLTSLGASGMLALSDERVTRLQAEAHAARTQIDAQHEPAPMRARPASGNVRRLTAAEFLASAEPALRTEPLSLQISNSASPDSAGLVTLRGHDQQIVGTAPQEFSASRLAQLVVRGRFVEGDRLQLNFHTDSSSRPVIGFSVPVRPGPGVQELRIVQPLGLYSGSGQNLLLSVALGTPPDPAGAQLRCQVTELLLVDERQAHASGFGSGSFQLGRTIRTAQWQSVSGSFRVELPAGATGRLKFSLALRHDDDATASRVALAARTDAGGPITLLERTLTAREGWCDLMLDLPSPAPAELLLTCEDLPADAVLAWAGLRLVDTSRPPRRVFVTLMDTLRADALSSYSSQAAPTPYLDALAGDGVLFERCISQCYWTRPSMASLMTSRQVQAAGVFALYERLPERYPTLAEVFAEAGFYAVSAVSNSNAGSDAGLAQGWDELTEQFVTPELSEAGDWLATVVEPRLPGLLDEDLLLYVHLMDAHGPYGPVEQPTDWVPLPGSALSFEPSLDRPWHDRPTDASRVALYRDDVARMDAGWGRFLERALARWETGAEPPAVLAVVSDHGEFLGEDGVWSHGEYALLPPVVHVPMILRAPGQLPAGARVAATVQNLDLAPTLLQLAGLATPDGCGWDGVSLVPLARGAGAERAALSSAGGEALLFAIYGQSGALVGKGGTLRHFAAPLGRADRSAPTLPNWMAPLLDHEYSAIWSRYRERGDAIRASLWSGAEDVPSIVDPDVLRQLSELGYLER